MDQRKLNEQDRIPIRCIPPTCQPYGGGRGETCTLSPAMHAPPYPAMQFPPPLSHTCPLSHACPLHPCMLLQPHMHVSPPATPMNRQIPVKRLPSRNFVCVEYIERVEAKNHWKLISVEVNKVYHSYGEDLTILKANSHSS